MKTLKILRYGNRKMYPIAWDASTQEKELQAFLELFQYFDGEYWQMYNANPLRESHKRLYVRAKQGDGRAAKKLLTLRKSYEYEEWDLIDFDISDGWKKGKLNDMFRQRRLELEG